MPSRVLNWKMDPAQPYINSATSVAAGDVHSLAVVSGTVYSWGSDEKGQLGTGVFDSGIKRSRPEEVVGAPP